MEGKGKARATNKAGISQEQQSETGTSTDRSENSHQGTSRNPEENRTNRKTSKVMKEQKDLTEV